ncbi:MAG: CoA pyrophosphatase [Paracoccaceae bacterium]
MPNHPFSDDLRATIQTRLNTFDAQDADDPSLRRAAVAIVVTRYPERHDASVLVTLRPEKLNRHGGQFALPGGRLDEGETEEQAALRELEEELGLTLSPDAIMGRLDHFTTRSGFRMAPIVMWGGDNPRLQPDPSEVAELFHLSFTELDSPDIPRLIASDTGDHPILSAFFPSIGHTMYAPTAAILYQFREIALRGQTTRAAHYEHPSFAWR